MLRRKREFRPSDFFMSFMRFCGDQFIYKSGWILCFYHLAKTGSFTNNFNENYFHFHGIVSICDCNQIGFACNSQSFITIRRFAATIHGHSSQNSEATTMQTSWAKILLIFLIRIGDKDSDKILDLDTNLNSDTDLDAVFDSDAGEKSWSDKHHAFEIKKQSLRFQNLIKICSATGFKPLFYTLKPCFSLFTAKINCDSKIIGKEKAPFTSKTWAVGI